jgi:O-antigen ligase
VPTGTCIETGGDRVTKAPTRTPIPASDLEPSLVFGQTYVTRRRLTRIDAAALLGLMMILISVIPFNLIVPGMTDLGRPGLVIGMLLFCWWVLARFTSHLSMTGRQPIRWAILAFMAAAMLSYAAGFLRSLTGIEANSADRTMLSFCILSGIILTAADGIPNWVRLYGVVQVLVWSATFVAALALIEYLSGVALAQYITIPGLQAKDDAAGLEARGAGVRVASTTSHYIELAAFLALALPFAIHAARFGSQRSRRFGIVAAIVIAGGIGASISRTGVLAVGLMFLILVPVWTWRARYNILCTTLALFAVMAAASPGIVKTLLNLFDDPSNNPAFTVRAARYPLVWGYFAEHPWLGRGTGTYISPQYQVLDNQWLSTLVSNGAIGVATLLALNLTGIILAFKALRRSTTPADRHLCAVLISTQVVAIAVSGTFDALSYSTYTTLFALSLGMCGAVWRLTHPMRTVRTSTTHWYLEGDAAADGVPPPKAPAGPAVTVGRDVMKVGPG